MLAISAAVQNLSIGIRDFLSARYPSDISSNKDILVITGATFLTVILLYNNARAKPLSKSITPDFKAP